MLYAVIVLGRQVVGPFSNRDDAQDWGDAFVYGGDTWQVVEMTDPKAYAAQCGESWDRP